MAPMTRTSKPPTGAISKKVHRKRSDQREPSNSWALMHHQETHPNAIEVPMEDESEDDMADSMASPNVVDSVEQLREVSDRVENKVEEFAEMLDQFLDELPAVENRYEAVRKLVSQFKNVASGVAQRIRQTHGIDLRDYMRREYSEQARLSGTSSQRSQVFGTSSVLGTRRAEQVKELRRWQQEADIWDLFRIMLDNHPFEADAQADRAQRDQQLEELGPPHRYTTESELWERFTLDNDLAREQQAIKEWLERTVEHQQGDLTAVQEVLEAKCGKGKGMWSSGWMDTREKIKAEKLRRKWPEDERPPLPQIKRSDNSELVATKLDLDAPARQGRSLEAPDILFERAMWTACWEMLRRGKDWDEVCAWCEERKEGWRAVCIGASSDGEEHFTSGATWRRVCEMASRVPNANEYESAVFGLLGGNMKAAEKMCRSIDDYLYAFYSTNLLKQFDQYIYEVCPQKALPFGLGRDVNERTVLDREGAEQAVGELIQKLRQSPATSKESREPMKIIQSYLLADEVGSLIHTIGAAAAQTSNLHGTDNVMFLQRQDVAIDTLSLPELEVVFDHQTLRIVAHMAILYGILNPEQLEGGELYEDENVLVSYIQLMRQEGKRDSIPVYASRLQPARSITVLSQTLDDIHEVREQREYLEMVKDAKVDTTAVIQEHLDEVMTKSLTGQARRPTIRILERADDTLLCPGQRIRDGFLPDQTSKADEDIVSGLSWFQLSEQAGWKVTFNAMSRALRKCIVYGRFACARAIVDTYPFDQMSLSKSYEAIGTAINVMDFDRESAPRNEKDMLTLDLLRRQSRTYYELCQLINAIECLSLWRTEEASYTSKYPKPHPTPASLKNHFEDVLHSMVPIVDGILMNAVDEEEAEDLNFIRLNYIPEVIIAYISVLQTGGNIISREYLLDAMDLANDLAKGKGGNGDASSDNGLEECFVQAGRMRELVECFALISKAMLIMKAKGRTWKGDKKKMGRDLGMWEIGGTGRYAGGVEEE